MTVYATARLKRSTPPDHNDPTTWLHRGEVAKMLGIPRETVRSIEKYGGLHPTKDGRGDMLFDPDEVKAWAMAHPRLGVKLYDDGDIAAAAFKLFEAGRTRVQVVIALRITCERVDALWEEWRRGDFEDAAKARHRAQLQAQAEQEAKARDQRRQRSLETLRKLQAKATRG